MANDEYLRYPGEQTFYKILAHLMGNLCLNTQYWSWYKLPKNKILLIQRFLVPIIVPICCASQALYLGVHYKEIEFSVVVVILSIAPVGVAISCKTFTAQTQSYKRALTAFMENIHLYNSYAKNYHEDKHNFVKKILIHAEKRSHYTFYIMLSSLITCYTSWLIVPIMHNFQNNESINNITSRLELTIYFWMPFDYEFNFYGYLFLQILEVYCGSITIFLMVLMDTVNLSFIFHLTGHINIYKYDLKWAKNSKLNDEEWRAQLIDLTKTYHFITKTFKDVEAAFGLNVATIYAQNLFQGGILLYQLMTLGHDAGVILTFGLEIPIFMGTLMFISGVLENVRIQADEIPALVYDLPWESMSISNQKIVQVILFQVQPTLEYTAAFNIKTGVQPALNIIKTTFSYYVMIKARKDM